MSGATSGHRLSELRARLEVEARGEPFLTFRDDQGVQQLVLLATDGESATVGRASSCRIVLEWDRQVSRVHARFERVADGWELIDDGSSNGTYANDERITRRQLSDGDRVRFGRTPAIVHLPNGGEPVAGLADVALSTTQRRVLIALCRPYLTAAGVPRPATDEEIAEEIFLSEATVGGHVQVLCAKLGIAAAAGDRVRERLIERAVATGLISDRDL